MAQNFHVNENIVTATLNIDKAKPPNAVEPLYMGFLKLRDIFNACQESRRARCRLRHLRILIIDGNYTVGLQSLLSFNHSALHARTGIQDIVTTTSQGGMMD